MSHLRLVAVSCRFEVPDDLPKLPAVITAAFGQTNEAALVDALRTAGALTISAVAEVGDQIVGHIDYSPVSVEVPREKFTALALAPMAVHPDWQRKGIGSALIRWSLDACQRLGHELVIVVGHAEFYARFGFVPAMPLGVQCPFEVPVDAFRLRELRPGALAGRAGTVRYHPEFAKI